MLPVTNTPSAIGTWPDTKGQPLASTARAMGSVVAHTSGPYRFTLIFASVGFHAHLCHAVRVVDWVIGRGGFFPVKIQKKVCTMSTTRYSLSITGIVRHRSKVRQGCEISKAIMSPTRTLSVTATSRYACWSIIFVSFQ
jgi:hypothetical protein